MADNAERECEYKWTDHDTEALITWRASNEPLFTGRRNAAQKAFEEFVRIHRLQGKIDPIKVKRKWENLKQKYKELKAPKTGVSTEGGETTAASWRWYSLMDETLGQRPSIRPPVLVDSSAQDVAVASPSSVLPTNPPPSTPLKRKREPDWLSVLRIMQEKEEEKDRIFTEREERREREALEREERKEKHRQEREERQERERREWEERQMRENREREEKREKEMREWQERMENLSQAREDKLLEFFKHFIEKK